MIWNIYHQMKHNALNKKRLRYENDYLFNVINYTIMNLQNLAERITDSILIDTILTKDNIQKRVKSILLIWNPAIAGATDKTKSTNEFILSAERKRIELNYWKEQARNRMDKNDIKKAYKEIDEILIDAGYNV